MNEEDKKKNVEKHISFSLNDIKASEHQKRASHTSHKKDSTLKKGVQHKDEQDIASSLSKLKNLQTESTTAKHPSKKTKSNSISKSNKTTKTNSISKSNKTTKSNSISKSNKTSKPSKSNKTSKPSKSNKTIKPSKSKDDSSTVRNKSNNSSSWFARRRKKKKMRQKKRAIRYKRPDKIIARIFSRLLILAAISAISFLSYSLYSSYRDSVKWTKVSSDKMASLPPSLLYSSSNDKHEAMRYMSLSNQVWNDTSHDFRKGVTQSKIDQLRRDYNQLKQSKALAKKSYSEIEEAWAIKKEYDDMFDVTGEIRESVMPSDVSSFIDAYYQKMANYMIRPEQYIFAERMQKNMINLASDTNYYNQIFEEANSTILRMSNSTLYISPDAQPSSEEKIDNLASKLHYKWSLVDKVQGYYSSITTLLEQNEKMLASYNEYEADTKKQKDFLKFKDAYNDTQTKANDALANNVVDYQDFTHEDKSKLDSWAKDNNIKVNYTKTKSSSYQSNVILSQSPAAQQFSKILKGSTIDVVIADYQAPATTVIEEEEDDDRTTTPSTNRRQSQSDRNSTDNSNNNNNSNNSHNNNSNNNSDNNYSSNNNFNNGNNSNSNFNDGAD